MALLDVEHEAMAAPSREEEGSGGGGGSKIRMFGVFDGHGGERAPPMLFFA